MAVEPNSAGDREAIGIHAPVILSVLLLFAFGALAFVVTNGETLAFDKSVLMMLRTAGDPAHPIGPRWLSEAVRDITALGSFSLLTIIVVAFASVLLLVRQRAMAAFIALTVLGGTALSSSLKAAFDRPRPDLTGTVTVFTSSFPSGHATVSAVVFLTLGAWLAGTTDRLGLKAFYVGYAVFLIALIGLSRLYLGVHYPTDVLAGWTIGTSWALGCWAAMQIAVSRGAIRQI